MFFSILVETCIRGITALGCHFHQSVDGCLSGRRESQGSSPQRQGTAREEDQAEAGGESGHGPGTVEWRETRLNVMPATANTLTPSCSELSYPSPRRLPWPALCGGSGLRVCYRHVLASVPKAAYSRLTFLSFTATVVVFQGFGVCDSLALIVLRVPPARQGLAAGLGDCEMTTLRLEHRGPIINREQTIGPSPIS